MFRGLNSLTNITPTHAYVDVIKWSNYPHASLPFHTHTQTYTFTQGKVTIKYNDSKVRE